MKQKFNYIDENGHKHCSLIHHTIKLFSMGLTFDKTKNEYDFNVKQATNTYIEKVVIPAVKNCRDNREIIDSDFI